MTTHLKSLKLVPVTRGGGDPVTKRREKLVERIAEQIALSKDSSYVRVERKRRPSEDGSVHLVEVPKPIAPWFRESPDGGITLQVRYGFRALELEKGKAGIAVPSREKLVDVLNTLISATRAGELDEVLAQAAPQGVGQKKAGKKRAA
jgi:hypothetical protein